MKYPALSEKQLSRFTYHWFWGLSVDQHDSQKTLYNEAVALQNNDRDVARLWEQMRDAYQLSWFIHMLCWFFNINNYRVNYYKLHSYISLRIYKEEITGFSSANQNEINQLGGFFVLNLLMTKFGRRLEPMLTSEEVSFFERQSEILTQSLNPSLPTEISPFVMRDIKIGEDIKSQKTKCPYSLGTTNTHTDKEPHKFNFDKVEQHLITVTAEMIGHFHVLELPKCVGESFTLKELSKAYKKSALRTHPDKTRCDNTDKFNAVTGAYKQLIELGSAQITQEFRRHLAEFKKLVKDALDRWRKIEWQVYEYNSKAYKYIDGVDKISVMSREPREDLNKLTDAFIDDVKAFLDGANAFLDDANAFLDGVNALMTEVHDVHEQVKTLLDILLSIIIPMLEEAKQHSLEKGLPPITEEEIDGCLKDPDYFNNKYDARKIVASDTASVVPVSFFEAYDGINSSHGLVAEHETLSK